MASAQKLAQKFKNMYGTLVDGRVAFATSIGPECVDWHWTLPPVRERLDTVSHTRPGILKSRQKKKKNKNKKKGF